MQAEQDTIFYRPRTLRCGGQLLDVSKPVVMGVLNVTPDSFFSGSREQDPGKVVERAKEMKKKGASIIDVGGYSSRPGADHIEEETEMNRVLPVLESLAQELPNLILSVDTFRESVAKKALEVGARMINDITGGTGSSRMFSLAAENKVPYVIMHMQGDPQTMQKAPAYGNVVDEVRSFMEQQAEKAEKAGVRDLIIDPGFGFGKTLSHNYCLLNSLDAFCDLGFPLLVGISRKSMVNKVLGTDPEDALLGTQVLNTLALTKGATILRVHDVEAARDAIRLVQRTWEEPLE